MDWGAFYWAPADVFAPAKFSSSATSLIRMVRRTLPIIRGVLKAYADGLYEKKGYTLNAGNEIEAFSLTDKRETPLSRNRQVRVR